MCGIFGVFRNISTAVGYKVSNDHIKNYMKTAALASQIRGEDSTGVVKVDSGYKMASSVIPEGLKKEDKPRVKIYKRTCPAKEFLKDETAKNLINSVHNYTLGMLGHTRSASVGNPHNNVNSHPHVCGRVVGIHNGTITNWEKLADKFNLPLRSRCDSEVIFAILNKLISDEGYTLSSAAIEISSHLEGQYACAFFDTAKLGTWGLFRKGAPLHIRYRSIGKTLFFASTNEILQRAYVQSEINFAASNKWYVDSTEPILPNNHGYVFIASGSSDDWVTKQTPFKLK